MSTEKEKWSEISACFKKFDTDGNGTLCLDEFTRFIRALNPDMEITHIRKAFEAADTKKNNVITLEEFGQWVFRFRLDVVDAAQEVGAETLAENTDSGDHVGRALGVFYAGEIKTWDLKTGRQLKTYGVLPELRRHELEHDSRAQLDEEPHLGKINCCTADWDGKRFLTGSSDHTIKLWNMQSAQVERTFHGCLSEVLCLAANWEKEIFVSGGLASQIKLWNLNSATPLETFQNDVATGFFSEKSGTKCVAVDWDRMLLLCGADQGLQLWSLDSRIKQEGDRLKKPQPIKKFKGHEKAVTGCLADFAVMRAVSASADKTLRLWDLEAGTELQIWTGHEGEILCLAGDLSRRKVVSGGNMGDIKLWNTETGECEKTLSRARATDSHVEMLGHEDAVLSIALGPRFRFVVSTSADGTVKMWDASNLKCIKTIEAGEERWGGVWVTDIEVEPRSAPLEG